MVHLDKLTVRYRQHPALHHLSGNFAPGSLTAVVGPNGAGKSTLLRSIAGLLPRAEGRLRVDVPRERVAYLPQHGAIDRSFPISVADCVSLGSWNSARAWSGVTSTMRARASQALHEVGMDDFHRRPIATLSTGQLQRVLFARLLLQDADLILLDEPFAAIDTRTSEALLRLVLGWHARQRTVIAVLHDNAQVRTYFPDTLLIARELVGWGPTASVLTEDGLCRARTLAQSWDDCAAHGRSDAPAPEWTGA